jgi:hypothetical protein
MGARPLLVVIAAVSVLGLDFGGDAALAAPAAGVPAASEGEPVPTAPSGPAPTLGGPVAADPRVLNLAALDEIKPADGVGGLNLGMAAFCSVPLGAGFTAPGSSTSGLVTQCVTQIFGRLICITCCTCIVVGGTLDCQCASYCAEG